MATLELANSSVSDLNLWFKINSGDSLVLGDITSIIPLRWDYLRDNWNFLRQFLIDTVPGLPNPDYINQQILDFDDFVDLQRNAPKKINPFSDAKIVNRYSGLFSVLPIDSINLNNEEEKIVEYEIARVSAFSKNDFINIKNNIITYRDKYVDIHGLSDADYDAAVGRSALSAQVGSTIVDVNYILTLQNAIKSVDFILCNLFAVDLSLDPFALARANANNPEINIGQYKSGQLVKLNYGESLQSLAKRYLGDSEKWVDIAIANGLKPPYIDEVGERISLMSNGNGSLINIAESDINGNANIDKFYINQPVFLKSNVYVVPDQRTIVNITQIPVSGEIILELDGDNNLSNYKISEDAHLRVYKPNTTNSAFYTLIPSETPLNDDRTDEVPWFLAKKSTDERKAKVDIALSDSSDLMFTTNGDLVLSYGIDNAIQAIKLKIVTELGSLRLHPEYGLVNVVGMGNSDIEQVRSMLINSLTEQIESDDRFDRIENISVDYLVSKDNPNAASAMSITLSVRMAGGQTVVPISFTINNQ